MDYPSLIAPKGTSGSIESWVNYSKLDTLTVLAEAQSLLWSILRVRQMRTEWTFGMAVGQSQIMLPDRFLDPIGRLIDITNQMQYGHNLETDIAAHRSYDNSLSGTLPNNPFTTALNSSLVTVHDVGHNLTQGSTVFYSGAVLVGGLTLNGAFPVDSVSDANNYVIDAGNAATALAVGGGAAISYTANQLLAGSPSHWAIWDGQIKFDFAFESATTFKHLYYRSPLPLSAANPTNWLTARYPMLLRKACQAAAADFMKDDNEYQKNVTALNTLAGTIAVQDDFTYRGAEFGTDTP